MTHENFELVHVFTSFFCYHLHSLENRAQSGASVTQPVYSKNDPKTKLVGFWDHFLVFQKAVMLLSVIGSTLTVKH